MPYGLTFSQIDRLTDALSTRLGVAPDQIRNAFISITQEEVARIAKNSKEDLHGN